MRFNLLNILLLGNKKNFFVILLVFSCLVIIISSCKKDIPPELSCDMSHPNQICREDAFRRGQFLGYIEYSYLSDNKLSKKKFFSVNQSYREEIYTYNEKGQLVTIKSLDKDGNTLEDKLIDYTDFDSLKTVTIINKGITTVYKAYEYNSAHQLVVLYDFQVGYMHKSMFLYQDDGKLYSETIYNELNNLVGYNIYKNFSGNITKIYQYDGDESLQGSSVYVKDTAGNLTEIRKFDKNNQLRQQETFLYVNNKLTKHGFLTGNYETEFRLFHYP